MKNSQEITAPATKQSNSDAEIFYTKLLFLKEPLLYAVSQALNCVREHATWNSHLCTLPLIFVPKEMKCNRAHVRNSSATTSTIISALKPKLMGFFNGKKPTKESFC